MPDFNRKTDSPGTSTLRVRDRWKRVKDAFHGAADLEPQARAAYLSRVCGGDAGIRAEVERLLRFDDLAASWLDDPARLWAGVLPHVEDHPTEEPPAALGSYRIVGLLGSGGMGSVYLAERSDGSFNHQVAVKIARSGRDDSRHLARFETERQLLASLRHPNIAHLYDGGVTEGGLPYFVMEFIDGRRIDDWCGNRRIGVRDRVRLFLDVCSAVQYAHERGIVHRDLKPSNILVDREGRVKLVDFGIAKLLRPAASTGENEQTVSGASPMTPAYAAPEQLQGDSITVRTDVYLLGVLLYMLLTDQHPRSVAHRRWVEGWSAPVFGEVPAPSTACRMLRGARGGRSVGRLEAAMGESLGQVLRQVRGDLDAIVVKALRERPQDRYRSVDALARDLRHWLERRPVSASKESYMLRSHSWVRRRWKHAALGMALLAAGTVFQQNWTQRVEAAQERAEQTSALASSFLDLLDPQLSQIPEMSPEALLDESLSEARTRLRSSPVQLARYMARVGRAFSSNGLPSRAIELTEEALELLRSERVGSTADVAAMEVDLASIYLDKQDDDSAEHVLNSAMTLLAKEPNARSVHYAKGLAVQSRLLRIRDSTRLSLETAEKAVLAIGSAVNRTTLDYVFCRDVQALALRHSGRLDEAETIFRDNLNLRQVSGHSSHPHIIDNINNLALVLDDKYLSSGDRKYLVEADRLMAQAAALGKGRLRSGHPVVANVLNSRGVVSTRLGRFEEAEAFHREALDIYQNRVDHEHPLISRVHFDLAFALKGQGRSEEAIDELSRAYAHSRKRPGERHRQTGTFAYELSLALEAAGRPDALDFAEEALATLRKALPEGHPETMKASMQVAKLLLARGDAERAEPLLREALAERIATLPEGHWRIGSSKSLLGECLVLQGKWREGTPYLKEGYRTMRNARGDADSKVEEARNRLERYLAKPSAPLAERGPLVGPS